MAAVSVGARIISNHTSQVEPSIVMQYPSLE
jgi:hypothetical protein